MNIQKIIIKGINELLLVNNFIVIPEFGGFVLKSNPSHFSASKGCLVPPSKTTGFNVKLNQNDYVLSLWIQNNLKCNSSVANQHLFDFSDYCKSILFLRKRLTIESIGFFYTDFENNICFEPQQDSNFLIESFGLSSMLIKEIAIESETKSITPVFIDRSYKSEKDQPITKNKKYKNKIIASVLAFVFLTSLLFFIDTEKFTGQLESSLFKSQSNSLYVPQNYSSLNINLINLKKVHFTSEISSDSSNILKIETENDKIISVKEKVAIQPFKKNVVNLSNPIIRVASEVKFEIVLGSFRVEQNAKNMLNSLDKNNISAIIVQNNANGLFVISIAEYETKEQASRKLLEIKPLFPQAWIKKLN